jgi:hypothetical protein
MSSRRWRTTLLMAAVLGGGLLGPARPLPASPRAVRVTLEAPRTPARFLLRAEGGDEGPLLNELVVSDRDKDEGVCLLRRKPGTAPRPIGRWRYGEGIPGFTTLDCRPTLAPGRYVIGAVADNANGGATFVVKADGSITMEP